MNESELDSMITNARDNQRSNRCQNIFVVRRGLSASSRHVFSVLGIASGAVTLSGLCYLRRIFSCFGKCLCTREMGESGLRR
jgi:hypothetical protein